MEVSRHMKIINLIWPTCLETLTTVA